MRQGIRCVQVNDPETGAGSGDGALSEGTHYSP